MKERGAILFKKKKRKEQGTEGKEERKCNKAKIFFLLKILPREGERNVRLFCGIALRGKSRKLSNVVFLSCFF